MKPFPTALSKVKKYLQPKSAESTSTDSLQVLSEKGFSVQLGITEADISALQSLSVQASILKYCPKDCTERFKDEETVRKWMEKQRLVFLLKETATGRLAGIAWTGPGKSPHIPFGKLTGGLRLSELFQGRGLASPFLQVSLEYTRQNYSSDLLWFECWQSNAGAVHIYQKLGFEILETKPGQRITPSGTYEPDTRVYMKLS